MRKNFGHLCCALALVALCTPLSVGDASALLIEDFNEAQTITVTSPTGQVDDIVVGAGILGGERDVSMTRLSGTGMSMTVGGGSVSYAQDPGATGQMLMVWDGTDGNIALDADGLGGVDITESGAMDAIRMSVLSSNVAGSGIIWAYTDDLNFSLATFNLPGNIPPDPQPTLDIAFTDFLAVGGTGADFTNIGALILFVDGASVPGLAAGIGSISTVSTTGPVPEPGTASLVALGMLGLGALRRSRR